MATLTGNKIKDTYSSLIKFSDNGTRIRNSTIVV